jgi:hypothetical protein
MAKNAQREAAIPNPALAPLSVLVGTWDTMGTHPSLPDTLHGSTTFEWIEGGAFLMMSSEVNEPGVPSSISILGSDDATDVCFMLYFDERGVSRKYECRLRDNSWQLWRNVPGFSQRFTGTFADEGHTIVGVWELSEDDVTWKRDLELTYTRVR